MSSPLKQNTTTIQELLNTINSLPEAGGVELPELTNEALASELFANKELIDDEGNKITGTFTIDSELTTQDSLISQIQTALQNKAAVTGEDVTTETDDYTAKLAILERAIIALETELQGKASGGSGGSNIETCTVSISFNYGSPKQILISGTQLVDNVVQTFVINTYNGDDTFSSPCNITNIIKNSPLTIVGNGTYLAGLTTCSGCELLCHAPGMDYTLLKITDSNASVIINNDY